MAPRAYKVEKVDKTAQYQPRTGGCSCHARYTVGTSSDSHACTSQKKMSYVDRFAGPAIFAGLLAAALVLGECSNRTSESAEKSLESRITTP